MSHSPGGGGGVFLQYAQKSAPACHGAPQTGQTAGWSEPAVLVPAGRLNVQYSVKARIVWSSPNTSCRVASLKA
jgi:hypothetical protein